MATSLKDKLKERHGGLSPLTIGRDKISTSDVTGAERLTLSLVHLIVSDDGAPFAVIVFSEFPNSFYFSGAVLTGIISDIYALLGAEVGEVLDITSENIVLSAETLISKNRRPYTNWKFVD
jgi:hypothetical protein